MTNDDWLLVENDTVTLQAANLVLRKQNIALERELAALREQVSSLRLELEGRVVGGTAVDGDAGAEPHDEQKAHIASATDSTDRSSPTVATTPPVPTRQDAQQQPQHQQQPPAPPRALPRHNLSRAQVERYSRHLLLPAFGVAAQQRLCGGSVLVVGCGGLGSPAAMYLAAAGVGRLGLVDHDTVDVTNLHRQVLHATSRVGMHKALSGRLTCAAINPTIQVEAHTCGFTPSTALPLTELYDVVVDASDNPATRYLVSDACVVSGKPLVSAAAVGTDGQLTVYNYGTDGPCYRCLFPESPAPENCSRCGEAGVLGVVPGVMGCLQALEVMKVLSGVGDVSSRKMTLFDALAGRFSSVRLRSRNPDCVVCGPRPAITRDSLPLYDYVLFTGQPPDDGPPEDLRLVDPRVRLEPQQVAAMLAEAEAKVATVANAVAAAAPGEEDSGDAADRATTAAERALLAAGVTGAFISIGGGDGSGNGGAGPCGAAAWPEADVSVQRMRTVLLDVRPQTQYDVMALPGAVHVPYERLEQRLPELLALLGVASAPVAVGTEGAAGAEAVAWGGVANPLSPAAREGGAVASVGSMYCGAAMRHEGAAVAASAGTVQPWRSVPRSGSMDGPSQTGAAAADNGRPADGTTEPAGALPAALPAAAALPRVVVLCRRGNNSQRVVARLSALGVTGVTDMRGGYSAWAREVDPDMPLL